MTTIFNYDSPAEVDASFLKALKTLFKNRRISITVNAEIDETEYLLSDEKTANFLRNSLKQVENGELIEVKMSGS
jgi:hypothetical protein